MSGLPKQARLVEVYRRRGLERWMASAESSANHDELKRAYDDFEASLATASLQEMEASYRALERATGSTQSMVELEADRARMLEAALELAEALSSRAR